MRKPQSLDQIRAEREEREARAAKRAEALDPTEDYHASGLSVVTYDHLHQRVSPIVECESHWDACLVLIALSQRKSRP